MTRSDLLVFMISPVAVLAAVVYRTII